LTERFNLQLLQNTYHRTFCPIERRPGSQL